MFSLSGVKKGSNIIWLVSMLTGDCLFPTEHRFHAEFTRPQKDGTEKKKEEEKERALRLRFKKGTHNADD